MSNFFNDIGKYSKTLVGAAGALTIYFNTYWATAKWEPTVIAGLAALGVLLVPNQKDDLPLIVQPGLRGEPGFVTITAAGGGAGGSVGSGTAGGGGGGGSSSVATGGPGQAGR